MTGRVEERRKSLHDELVKIAAAQIVADGLGGLRARELAKTAGCAVGAIYNVFGDLNDLALAVNARTLKALADDVGAALSGAPKLPADQLKSFAQTYHHFARENQNLWRALFEAYREKGDDAPEWYLTEMDRLHAYIRSPLASLNPTLDPAALGLLTNALFSSVHGIVLLALDADQSTADIDVMTSLILEKMTASQALW